ncbi:universal stress protein [Flavobacteriaceae bacterium F08102]|nr:universal stress protein [Flavobacteriaceae bacterium F08102]
MKHILLPTDFSENSWNAIQYAIQLYKKEPCKFYLLNAYTSVIYNVGFGLETTAQYALNDAAKKISTENLEKLHNSILKKFPSLKTHEFELVSKFNTLVFAIKEVVESEDIDLIIMGTKGATGAKEVLFGSNTVHAFNNIHCPILAIPSGFTYEAPKEILFPTDLSVNYNETRLNLLREIAVAHNSRVNALHVSTGYDLTEFQQQNESALKSYFKGVAYLFHDVESMEVPEAINKFQIRYKINLLAMINNKHSFFENLFFKNSINKIGFHLNIPFLVLSGKKR